MNPRQHYRGMTLLEVMVAIALLAVVGAMATKGLSQVIRARDVVFSEQARWRSVAMAWARIGEDTTTTVGGLPIDLPSTHWQGSRTAARWAVWGGAGGVLPIQYALRGTTLLRIQGADLSRPQTAEPGARPAVPPELEAPLLEGVRSLALSYLDAQGEWQPQWPPEGSSSAPTGAGASVNPAVRTGMDNSFGNPMDAGSASGSTRPRAVRFALTLDDGRDVTRIYALP